MKNTSIKQEEQFTIIPHSLMSSKDLSDQDKLTLGIILSFIKNGKECYIGNDTLGEMLGITKNAASTRVLRLQKIGCVSLRYTYREGTMEVDKRFITLLSMTPQVSSTKRKVSSTKQRGIVSQTKGYSPTDDEVSSKLGGIIQPDNTSLLNKELNKLPHNLLNKENTMIEEQLDLMLQEIEEQLELEEAQLELISEETDIEEQLEKLELLYKEDNFSTGDERGEVLKQIHQLKNKLTQLTLK